MAELDRFLAEAEAKAFKDGVWDCCLFPAAWVKRVTGIDGAAPWRGRYRTRLGWLRILKREGGVIGVMSRGAALAGLTETTTPMRGDIGVVHVADVETAAVFLGGRWATAGPAGIVAIQVPFVKAWSVPCQA